MTQRTRPNYYLLPNGIECKDVAQHFTYNVGTAFAYLWRAGRKHEEGIDDLDKQIEDIEKAVQHLQFELQKLRIERETKRNDLAV